MSGPQKRKPVVRATYGKRRCTFAAAASGNTIPIVPKPTAHVTYNVPFNSKTIDRNYVESSTTTTNKCREGSSVPHRSFIPTKTTATTAATLKTSTTTPALLNDSKKPGTVKEINTIYNASNHEAGNSRDALKRTTELKSFGICEVSEPSQTVTSTHLSVSTCKIVPTCTSTVHTKMKSMPITSTTTGPFENRNLTRSKSQLSKIHEHPDTSKPMIGPVLPPHFYERQKQKSKSQSDNVATFPRESKLTIKKKISKSAKIIKRLVKDDTMFWLQKCIRCPIRLQYVFCTK